MQAQLKLRGKCMSMRFHMEFSKTGNSNPNQHRKRLHWGKIGFFSRSNNDFNAVSQTHKIIHYYSFIRISQNSGVNMASFAANLAVLLPSLQLHFELVGTLTFPFRTCPHCGILSPRSKRCCDYCLYCRAVVPFGTITKQSSNPLN